MKNHYLILFLNETATSEEIKKQYRILSLKYHPDKNGGDKEAAEKFREVAEAYKALSDKQEKQKLDTWLNAQKNNAKPLKSIIPTGVVKSKDTNNTLLDDVLDSIDIMTAKNGKPPVVNVIKGYLNILIKIKEK